MIRASSSQIPSILDELDHAPVQENLGIQIKPESAFTVLRIVFKIFLSRQFLWIFARPEKSDGALSKEDLREIIRGVVRLDQRQLFFFWGLEMGRERHPRLKARQ